MDLLLFVHTVILIVKFFVFADYMTMELDEFIPKTGTFHLAHTNKTYHLRKISLADEAWLKTRFGSDVEVSKIFTEMNIFAIAEIAFHQLVDEERAEFLERDVKFIDDNGKELIMKLGGYKLLFSLISGWSEKSDIVKGLLETIGVSRPTVTKAEMEAEQAKQEHFKKKINDPQNQSPLTGQESAMSSVASTVGP